MAGGKREGHDIFLNPQVLLHPSLDPQLPLDMPGGDSGFKTFLKIQTTCLPLLLSKPKGTPNFAAPAGRGDSAALHETTRRWFFHRTRRGRRPSASLGGNPFGLGDESENPAGAFANRVTIPAPHPGSYPRKQRLKVKGGKIQINVDRFW